MKKHPSGRPIRDERVVSRPIWRVPDKGSVIPRLQEPQSNITSVGFTADFLAREEGE